MSRRKDPPPPGGKPEPSPGNREQRRSDKLSDDDRALIRTTLKLTERELEVELCLVDDLSDFKIAKRLEISQKTVHTHLHNLYLKLGVRSRTGVVARVYETLR